jgi:hypothetical protein
MDRFHITETRFFAPSAAATFEIIWDQDAVLTGFQVLQKLTPETADRVLIEVNDDTGEAPLFNDGDGNAVAIRASDTHRGDRLDPDEGADADTLLQLQRVVRAGERWKLHVTNGPAVERIALVFRLSPIMPAEDDDE